MVCIPQTGTAWRASSVEACAISLPRSCQASRKLHPAAETEDLRRVDEETKVGLENERGGKKEKKRVATRRGPCRGRRVG